MKLNKPTLLEDVLSKYNIDTWDKFTIFDRTGRLMLPDDYCLRWDRDDTFKILKLDIDTRDLNKTVNGIPDFKLYLLSSHNKVFDVIHIDPSTIYLEILKGNLIPHIIPQKPIGMYFYPQLSNFQYAGPPSKSPAEGDVMICHKDWEDTTFDFLMFKNFMAYRHFEDAKCNAVSDYTILSRAVYQYCNYKEPEEENVDGQSERL